MCNEVNWKYLNEFKTVTIVSSTLIFNGLGKPIHNVKTSAAANFTLVLKRISNGGNYNLIVLKSIAGDVVITLPASSKISGSADTTITLTGDVNTSFWINFTKDATYNYFTVTGSSASGGSGGVVIEEVTASRMLTILDSGKHLICNSEAPMTITIPAGLPKTPTAFNCVIYQKGNGKITILPAGGVTLNEPDLQYSTAKKYATIGVLNNGLILGDEIYTLTGYTTI
ncbi:MAG: hypothetical protein PSX81_02750 [bacterium]|nr:hypothetical protein [bacterium]